MKLWNHSTMETYYADGSEVEHVPCEVRIDGRRIVVSYASDTGFICYEGNEVGDGHFELTGQGVKGRATLHGKPGGDILEGWWLEDGAEGMWRLHLDDEA